MDLMKQIEKNGNKYQTYQDFIKTDIMLCFILHKEIRKSRL